MSVVQLLERLTTVSEGLADLRCWTHWLESLEEPIVAHQSKPGVDHARSGKSSIGTEHDKHGLHDS